MSLRYETKWLTCVKCNALVAARAVVFEQLPPDLDPRPHRPARFGAVRGELWETALLVGGDGLAMDEPRFCPACGRKAVG